MECLLCKMWALMPYAKRYTTPTTAEQTQGALIVGYWAASRATSVPRICEPHMAVINMLDLQEEQRIANERLAQERLAHAAQANQLPPELQAQVNGLQERQRAILNGGPQAAIPVPVVQPIVPVPVLTPPVAVAPPVEKPFTLGPGPLTNENTISPVPPMPAADDPVAVYTGVQPAAAPHIVPPPPTAPPIVPPIVPTSNVGTAEGALEAARMPAVDGGKVEYPCPSCGKVISTGDVHAC